MSSRHKEPQNHTWTVDLRAFQGLFWVIRYGLYAVHPPVAAPGHFCSLCFNALLHQIRALKNWLGTLNPCEEVGKEGKMHRHKRMQFPITLFSPLPRRYCLGRSSSTFCLCPSESEHSEEQIKENYNYKCWFGRGKQSKVENGTVLTSWIWFSDC